MGNVIITSDSTCDLSPALLERYDVKTIPLYVTMDDQSFKDGIELLPDDLYAYVAKTGKLPKTAAVSESDFLDFFAAHKQDGCELLHIGIGSGFSVSYQNALLAAQQCDGVFVADSENLSTGTGLLVIKAVQLAQEGKSGREITAAIQSLVSKVRASFVIDTLQYLYKGGRCSALAALGANLLKLKPQIQVKDNKMDVAKKFRGQLPPVLEQYTEELLTGGQALDLSCVFITHSGTSEENIERVKAKIQSIAKFEEIHVTRAGCVISNHCGYNTLGVLFIVK